MLDFYGMLSFHKKIICKKCKPFYTVKNTKQIKQTKKHLGVEVHPSDYTQDT